MATVSRGNGPHVLRQLNAAAVLDALRKAGAPVRVADLMARTGLTRPTVTQALSLLETEGWTVASPDETASRMGRPAQLVRFKADAGHVLGVDVGPHKVLAIVADLDGTVIAEQRADTSAATVGVEVMAIAKATMLDALHQARVDPQKLFSVALGTPGVVDAGRGTVLLAPSIPGWASIPIVKELSGQFGGPIFIENDVNLAALAEQSHQAVESTDTMVLVQWGVRIGAGIMIGGRLHRGAASAAGEVGFIDLAETPTPAGNLGAFERTVGSEAIAELAATRAGTTNRADRPSASAVLTAAANGDPAALEVLDEIAARFARGIAPMLMILDPDLVVIGGAVARGGPVLLDAVNRHLQARAMLPAQLRLSELGDRAVTLGAVRLALNDVQERLFAPEAFANRA